MLRYAAITPARDEVQNLQRLASSILTQTVLPTTWVVVDNGSTDGTLEVARGLAGDYEWIRVITESGSTTAAPGAPIVRAFHAGLRELDSPVDVVVKLDADARSNRTFRVSPRFVCRRSEPGYCQRRLL